MTLEFDDKRLIRWLTIYGASVAVQAEDRKLTVTANLQEWEEIFERARDVANMDKEHGRAPR